MALDPLRSPLAGSPLGGAPLAGALTPSDTRPGATPGAGSAAGTSAPAALPAAEPARGGLKAAPRALPADAPAGTEPDVWGLLGQEELHFFADAGPAALTYLRGRLTSAAAPERGARLDVRG